MKRSSYGERDYPFGQAMLTLRTNIGLTQADLAELLGVSRKAVIRWEAGGTYPKVEHLKALLAFAVKQQAFAAGHEEEEIRAFWQAAHQKVLLDELWLDDLLATQRSHPTLVAPRSPNVALWTVPYARNPHFTGRDDLLSQLEQQFALREADQPTTIHHAALTQAQAIKGLGGIGKTQIAVEYAYRAREQGRFTHTLWITSASEEAVLTSFAILADLLPVFPSKGETDQRKLVAAIIGWLEQCQQPWLLIMDNADDLSLVQPYLPRLGNGNILFTTRAYAVSSRASSIEVDSMSVIEGTQLLLRRAHRFVDASDDEINEASNLVMALGQFPLALDQAGAYIEETGCSVSDYLQLYQTHRQALLARRGKQATGYPESVATTWTLSFRHIEQTNPAVVDLLQLCAFLSSDHIPEELLIQGASYWPSSLQQAVVDPFTFNQLLETLLSFSLVKRLSKDHMLSIHRLVQVVHLETMQWQEQRQWAERVVRAVNAVFPRDPENDVDTWPQCLRYLEQAQACETLIQQHQILLLEAAEMLDRTGTYLQERALYTLARPLYLRALYIFEQQVRPEQLKEATLLKHLATLHYRQGEYIQAELLHQRVLSIQEQLLGPEHPEVAASLSNLAVLYTNQGKYTQAEPLLLRALHIQEQLLGPEHSEVASSLNNLADLYYQQGKYAKAEPLFLRVLHIDQQQVGTAHPNIAYPLNNLANLYQKQGRYAEAELLHQQALHIRERLLGSEHPDVSSSLNNLAFLYYEQGKYTQAEPLYQQALRIREQYLGPEHPQVAYPLHGLALIYVKQRKYTQAEPLYQRILRIREQQLGLEHIETAAVLHDFAGFRQAQGQHQEAASMYQRALTTREHVLGPDHPLTIETHERLHAVLATLGRAQEVALEGRQREPEMRE